MSEYIKCPNCNGTGELPNGKECEVCDGGMKINDKELSELITALRNDSYREGMNDQKLEHVSEPVMTSNTPDSLREVIFNTIIKMNRNFAAGENGWVDRNIESMDAIMQFIEQDKAAAVTAARIDELNKVAKEIFFKHDTYAQYINDRMDELKAQQGDTE